MPLTRPLSIFSATLALLPLTFGLLAQQPAAPAVKQAATSTHLKPDYARLPLAFEPNRGQTDAQVQFVARTPQATVFLAGPDAVIRTSSFTPDGHGQAQLAGSTSIRMHLAGAQLGPSRRQSRHSPAPSTICAAMTRNSGSRTSRRLAVCGSRPCIPV